MKAPAGSVAEARVAVLRVLHLEDNPIDSELVQATILADWSGAEISRVETRGAFAEALQTGGFDIILADYNLPSFDGVSAQIMATELRPDLPFIFVSGSIGEEQAIDRVIAGATDYVLKDRLRRLSPALQRALAEVAERTERQRADEEVRLLNAELEQRVLDRTQALAAANTALAAREVELRRAEAFMSSIVENIPHMIFVKEAHELRFVQFNKAGEELLGVSRENLLGHTDLEIFPKHQAELQRAEDRRVLADAQLLDIPERAIETAGKGIRILHTKKIPIRDEGGETKFLLGISEDITERKAADNQLRIAQLDAERANQAKSEFLSRMSHDLRTPLNSILGFSQLLAGEDLDADRLECVRQILKGGTHLLELITEVLDMARIDAGQLSLSPEPVNAAEIVQQVLALMAPLAAERDIALTVPNTGVEWSVVADRQRLNQILLNLLSNAVKYNHQGGRIAVDFAVQPARRLRITVTDTGPGIPAEKLDLLFNPFERLGAESTAVEGTGLGLALSQKLAQAMGGKIGVESVMDRGSVFWVELALSEVVAPAIRNVEAPPHHATDADVVGTVLYVEDNLSNVRLMERIFKRRPNVTLLHADRGRTGLEMARRYQPCAVFLDLHLSDIHGEDVLRQLWADPILRAIPVAVLSADATPGQIQRLTASGAAAYLTKPLDIGKVLALLDDFLTRAQRIAAPIRTERAS